MLRWIEALRRKEEDAARNFSVADLRSEAERKQEVHCSFCGKSHRDAKKIIVRGPVGICDVCVDLCVEICRQLGRDDLIAVWENIKIRP